MAKTQTKAFTNAKPITLPDDARPEWCAIDLEYSATTYAVGDIVQLATIPIGFKALDWVFVPADADSNVGPVLAFSLGVANADSTDLSAEVWGTALLSGTSAVTRNTTNAAAQGVKTTDRVLALKCTTAAATYDGAGKVGQLLVLLQG